MTSLYFIRQICNMSCRVKPGDIWLNTLPTEVYSFVFNILEYRHNTKIPKDGSYNP